MTKEMQKEVDTLPSLTVNKLRDKFAEVFGYRSNSRNREFLIRKITWGIQAKQWGDISEESRVHAYKIADFNFLRRCMLKPKEEDELDESPVNSSYKKTFRMSRDPRLPMPGCIITKEHDARLHLVHVLNDGFEYENEVFRSLTAVAKKITGSHWNGYAFFGLGAGK